MASKGNSWTTYYATGDSDTDQFVESSYHHEVNGPHVRVTSTVNVPGRHELTTQPQSGQQSIRVPRLDLTELARDIQRVQNIVASPPKVFPYEVPAVFYDHVTVGPYRRATTTQPQRSDRTDAAHGIQRAQDVVARGTPVAPAGPSPSVFIFTMIIVIIFIIYIFLFLCHN